MDIGGVGRRPERTHEVGVLLCVAKASALAVHGVLDVQTDGTRGDQALDERLRVLPVAGLDVDGDRDVDRRGDLRMRVVSSSNVMPSLSGLPIESDTG